MAKIVRNNSVHSKSSVVGNTLNITLNTTGPNRLAVIAIYGFEVTSITGGGVWTKHNTSNGSYSVFSSPYEIQQTNVPLVINYSGSIADRQAILETFSVEGDSATIPKLASPILFIPGTYGTGINSVTLPANTTDKDSVTLMSYLYLSTPSNAGATAVAGAGFTLGSDASLPAVGLKFYSEISNGIFDNTLGNANMPISWVLSENGAGPTVSFALRPNQSILPLPPTNVTAVYVAGQGITISWTPPGVLPNGFRLYKSVSNDSTDNRVYSDRPDILIPSNTTSFTDKVMGYPPIEVGGNVFRYYLTSVVDGVESLPSNITNAVTFLG